MKKPVPVQKNSLPEEMIAPPDNADTPEDEGSETGLSIEGEDAVANEETLGEGTAADPAEDVAEAVPADSEAEVQILKRVIEAILFASQKPVSSKELIAVFKGAAEVDKENPDAPARILAKIKAPQIQAAIEELELDCSGARCTHEVRETAAGWQLVTKPEFSPWLRQLYPENRPARLSAPAMETLAIIAYRQPITRADIEAVRGVAVDGVMQTLLDRSLVKIGGRADVPGRPLLYETTQYFMEHFGLKDLEELPNASELRTISLPKAEVPAEELSTQTDADPEASGQAVEPVETPESSSSAPEDAESSPPLEDSTAVDPDTETDLPSGAESDPMMESTESVMTPEEAR